MKKDHAREKRVSAGTSMRHHVEVCVRASVADEGLLDEMVAFINAEYGGEYFERENEVTLSAGAVKWCVATVRRLPVKKLWAGLVKFCEARRCEVEIESDGRKIRVKAGSVEDAARLLRDAGRIVLRRK